MEDSANTHEQDAAPGERDAEDELPVTKWKDLFNFTTRRHIPLLVTAFILAVFAGVAVPADAYLMGKLFDTFSKHASGAYTSEKLKDDVSKYCLYLAALALGNWVVNTLFYASWMMFGELQARSARERIFEALLKRNIEWFDKRKNGIGAMVPRLQMQTRELQMSVSQPLGGIIEKLSTTFLSLGLAFYYSWKLTLVILCIVPVAFFAVAILSSHLQPNIDKQSDKLNEALKYAIGAMTSIDTVKCFNGQNLEVWKYTKTAREAANYYVRQANLNSLQLSIMSLVTFGMFVQGFWYGSTLLDKSQTPGHVLTTFWAALMACQGFTSILPQLMVMEKGRAAGAKLRAVMVHGLSKGREDTGDGFQPDHCAGDIEMKKICFSYPIRPNELALNNASLFFAAGEMTFVIGRSGSGKSTIGQILSRFYTVKSGQVTLDGHRLENIDIGWLRRNLTLVEQTSVLFEGSIFCNISYGREDFEVVTLEDAKMAAQFALLQETINDLPDGWDTYVGSKGTSMSGGQRQRVALARARLRDTPILILDESTSALDYINRTLVLEAIRVWRRGKTTIIITHDIAQILPDDYVYVLEKGKVVQDGYRRSMEKVARSPFQKFLAIKEEDEEEDNDDGLRPHIKDGQAASLERRASDSSSKYSTDSDSIVDPLDMYLEKTETGVLPYMPSIFIERPTDASRRNSMMIPPAIGRFSRIMPPSNTAWSPFAKPPLSPSASSTYSSQGDMPVQSDLTQDYEVGLGITSVGRRRRRSQLVALHNRVPILAQETKYSGKKSPLVKMVSSFSKKRGKANEGDCRALTIKQILVTVWPRLDWVQRILLIVAFITCCFHAVATPVFAYVFNKLLTTFYIKEGRQRKALIYSLAILGLAIFDGIANYTSHFLLEYCGMMWVHNVRAESIKRLLDQPREFFDREENNVNSLAENLDYHAEEMRNVLGRFAGFILIAVLMMGTAIVWSLISAWKLSLVGLTVVPVFWAITSGFSTVSGKQEGLLNDADETATAIFAETFINIKTVRSLTLEKTLHDKYFTSTRNIVQVGIKRAAYSGLFFGLTDSVIYFVTALLFYYGGVLVSSNEFTTQHILQVFSELTMSMTNVNAIVSMIPQIGSSRDTATRLLRLASLPTDSHETVGTTRIPLVGDIVMHNLRFHYPTRPEAEVLRGIDMTIKAGTCVAIVGASGSGKSTIASLLLSLYTPDASDPIQEHSGITLSARDIKHLHTPTLRTHITLVSQTPTIFPATVAENITYGLASSDPLASPNNVRDAAAGAGIDEFLASLPAGYDTLIGEGGVGLSGGQAQRIAIARALVRRPDVLVLDEATSALDVESAGIVRATVERLISGDHGMTVIIITHSREMMAIAEQVVMLGDGKVLEMGGFEELKRRRGAFARLLKGGELDNE
ncbi:uncharacterized protein K452DRAFT_319263 [Aplosporella prunicola CBS 121167]|uniref:Uncharacterized protein n=1 Tax=Aplosporella prunicola CBS 121167 TaxID=1176127 RepID=A0A6A6BES3_9PEZI|nr:uncharacterized protein K452DRAFT_319263 [Aplosporella prunicola CBS 121167]KAF2140981.1 hypothetical protein K452DRAFT_319263 [Aplosporella prunicola CBS 121167]